METLASGASQHRDALIVYTRPVFEAHRSLRLCFLPYHFSDRRIFPSVSQF